MIAILVQIVEICGFVHVLGDVYDYILLIKLSELMIMLVSFFNWFLILFSIGELKLVIEWIECKQTIDLHVF